MTNKDLMEWGKFLVGVVALVGLAWLIHYLLHQVGAQDPEWTRLVYLLTGVEAVAFAGAGFIFGKDVNRARAENAESLARSECTRANQAEGNYREAIGKGKALSNAISAKLEKFDKEQPLLVAKHPENEELIRQLKSEIRDLESVARTSFP